MFFLPDCWPDVWSDFWPVFLARFYWDRKYTVQCYRDGETQFYCTTGTEKYSFAVLLVQKIQCAVLQERRNTVLQFDQDPENHVVKIPCIKNHIKIPYDQKSHIWKNLPVEGFLLDRPTAHLDVPGRNCRPSWCLVVSLFSTSAVSGSIRGSPAWLFAGGEYSKPKLLG